MLGHWLNKIAHDQMCFFMLDPKLFRSDIQRIEAMMASRGGTFPQEDIEKFEAQRKALQVAVNDLQHQRNAKSKQVGQSKAKGESVENLLTSLNELTGQLKDKQAELQDVQTELHSIYMKIPNLLHISVPMGKNESDNVVTRHWGTPPEFDFSPKEHTDLLSDSMDFTAAAELTGSRFVVLRHHVARLHRALAQFMLDLHTSEHGYQELYVPYMVNQNTMTGTGQLPKLEDDVFKIEGLPYYLIPTAEVPVTSLASGQIALAAELPKKFVSHTPCFRREAGSYGRDTHGLIRQHQFDKVELVWITHPERSYSDLEQLLSHAEAVLQRLELPYRVLDLCSGDIGFSAAKTYDIEVWLPGQGAYREISSCSNCTDFQARRMQARWRAQTQDKPQLVHTLNGSGLAVGRTLIAVLENYQDKEGGIKVPQALVPYLGGETYFPCQSNG